MKLLSIILLSIFFSCSTDDKTTHIVELQVQTTIPIGELEEKISKLELFITDNTNKNKRAEITNFDTETLIANAKDVGGFAMLNIPHQIVVGEYTLWMWANVNNPDVYSFDHRSIEQKNNIIGENYMLVKNESVSIFDNIVIPVTLEDVTVKINLKRGTTTPSDVSIIIEPPYTTSVSNTMEYTKTISDNNLDFSGSNIPNTTLYLFPCSEGTYLTYTYKTPEGNSTKNITISALELGTEHDIDLDPNTI